LASIREGDSGGAILDGVAFAVEQLVKQPAPYRRAILLLSETIDHGSKATLGDTLRLISDTNTTMYSFGFSSTTSAVSHEASKFGTVGIFGAKVGNSEPGPPGGCFSREGADAEYQGHYDKQVLDCISQLAPPLRLATMAFLTARNALRTNAAEAVAQLTGGEFFHFHNGKDLKKALIAISNDVPNYYVLSFRPSLLTEGMHTRRAGFGQLCSCAGRGKEERETNNTGCFHRAAPSQSRRLTTRQRAIPAKRTWNPEIGKERVFLGIASSLQPTAKQAA
jgi:hypothetical protein